MSPTKTVLLVDNEEEILRGVNIWLSAAGFATSMARDGVEAVASAKAERPDAIVMDVCMPIKDGLVATAELKQLPETQNIPIVMLSASLLDQERALDAGASCFLKKPYDGRILVETVKTLTKSVAFMNPA